MAILHWKFQRFTAIALVPGMLYLTFYLLTIDNFSYARITSDISSFYGVLFISIVSSLLYFHSSLGIETILQDYVHDIELQNLCISLSKITHVALLTITLICLYLITGY
ncbi:MAG: succinate dehydrogenase, hydrophobic membrane anchor protein [Gammaproteobacteria bacterium]|nr:succinate dehydrogenase, hydrophobic membrane anchor protein [Gammaproteobacteria bacterium]